MTMNIPTKKLRTGFELPIYGLGLWQVGGRHEVDTSKDIEEVEAIRFALEQGITHIDTAESYGVGHSEELLGKAIKDYERKKLFLATKVSWDNQKPEDLKRSLEASLKRLATDYIDLYYLHRFPSAGTDIAGTIRTLDELVDQKLIKHIGVSNFSVERLQLAQSLTRNKIVCNQVHYNLQIREVETKGLLKYCQENDVLLVAYRPLQKGSLEYGDLVQKLASKYHKTPNQIAINWLMSQDSVVTLVKTSHRDHLLENLGAIGWQMEAADVELLRKDYPAQLQVSDVVALDHPL